MNINRLINSYFLCQEPAPTIEVFDKDTIYSTYPFWQGTVVYFE